MSRYVNMAGSPVQLDAGGGTAADQYPLLLDDGAALGSSSRPPLTATAHATPHTLGTAVEIDASLSADAGGIFFYLTTGTAASVTDTATLVEIVTGAGLATHWQWLNLGHAGGPSFYYLPGFIAAGTRVGYRVQGAVSAQAVTGVFSFLDAKASVPGAPVDMGVDLATSRGTALTAPGATNTKSAWTEIEDSTAAAFTQLAVSIGGNGGTSMSATGILIDIGIGGAGSETVLVADIHWLGGSSEFYQQRTPMTFGVEVAAGSRLSARYARANAGNAVDLLLVGA